jgi:hypothetical protein
VALSWLENAEMNLDIGDASHARKNKRQDNFFTA